MTLKTTLFDASEYLDTPEGVTEFLADACGSRHAGVIVDAINIVARAKGMTELARQAGVSRQALYDALKTDRPQAPDIIHKVLSAAGVELTPPLAA